MIRVTLIAVIVVMVVFALGVSGLGAQSLCVAGVDYLAQAAQHLEQRDYPTAAADYACAIAGDGLNWEAHLGAGTAALLAQDYVTVFLEYRLVDAYAPDLLVDLLYDQSAAIAANPGDIQAYTLRAFIHYWFLDGVNAQPDYDQIIALEPNNAFAYLFRASSNQYNGQAETVAADFARALELAPDNASIYNVIAYTYAETGAFDLALPHFERAFELAPDVAEFHHDRANTARAMGDYLGAIDGYTRAIELSPPGAAYYYYNARGNVYNYNLGNYDQAIEDYTRAMELLDISFFYATRGDAYAALLNFEGALVDYGRAIELNPAELHPYLNRASVYNLTGEPELAAQDLLMLLTQLNSELIPVNGTLTPGRGGQAEMSDGRAYQIPLDLAANQPVTITATSESVAPLLLIFAPDGTPIVGAGAIHDQTQTAITDFLPPVAGIYTLIVSHALGGSTGLIDLGVLSE
jgi:tetratricopeptide (TPR) repeat protein